jgi:putative oxidoreductase
MRTPATNTITLRIDGPLSAARLEHESDGYTACVEYDRIRPNLQLMPLSPNSWPLYAPYVLLALRIISALLFFQHGAEKLFGFAGARAVTPESLLTMRGIAGLLETIGPALLIVGLFTRLIAFILCGEMAVAYFMSWAPRGFWPINNGGEEAVLFCYLYLWLVTMGPGPWSVDGWVQNTFRRGRPASLTQWLSSLEPYARSILRIIVGFIIVQHGARKAFGVLAVMVGGRRNVPPLALDGLPGMTGYLDLVTGTFLMLGLFTRPTAVVVAIELVLAYILAAAPRGPWPIRNGGGEALLAAAILVYLTVVGAGAWSADRVRTRNEHRDTDTPTRAL